MRDVAFSCDDNGARFLCVTVWSLLEHYKGSEPLRINVFEGWGGHSPQSKLELESVVGEWNKRHDVHSPTPTHYSDLNEIIRQSLTIYARVDAPKFSSSPSGPLS